MGEDHESHARQLGPVDPDTMSFERRRGMASRSCSEFRNIVDEPSVRDSLRVAHPARDEETVEVVLDDGGDQRIPALVSNPFRRHHSESDSQRGLCSFQRVVETEDGPISTFGLARCEVTRDLGSDLRDRFSASRQHGQPRTGGTDEAIKSLHSRVASGRRLDRGDVRLGYT